MTTQDSPLVNAAMEEGAVAWPPATVITFVPMRYETVKVTLSGDAQFDNEQIDYALERFWHGYLKNAKIAAEHAPQPAPDPPQQSPAGPQRPQQRQGAQRSQYPPDGLVSTLNDATQWTCDKCHGTGEGVARRPQKGGMQSDAIVCLNPQCKENNYRYTIAWDDGTTMGPVDNGQADISEGALPF